MKELKSIEHSNYREILGKVTLKNKNMAYMTKVCLF